MVGGITSIAGITTATTGRAANSKDREPLEETPSTVTYLTYEPGIEKEGFGFPDNPAGGFLDDKRLKFDTTALEIATNGNQIYHTIPLPGGKPYIIKHENDGRYKQRGAVINFEVDEANNYGLEEGQYRATVREDVQLYEKGGYFNWSVSRIDLFRRPGMEYVGPSLIVIWDEDGDENDDHSYRTYPYSEGISTPNVVLDPDVLSNLGNAAEALMKADSPNPGGN